MSQGILYLRRPINLKKQLEIDASDDMKKVIKNALRPVTQVFSSGLARLAGFSFLVLLYVTLAITFYQQYEGWSITDSIFFVAQTLSTIGYGYPSPSSDNSRLFTIFFILIGIFVVFAGVQDLLYSNIGVLRKYLCGSSSRQMSEDLATGDINHYRRVLVRLVFGLAVTIVLGAVTLKFNEDMTWTTAFYFIVETATTVGYGDIVLVHPSSRQFTVAFIIVCTTLVALTIRTFSSTLQEDRQLDILENRLRKMQALRFNKNLPITSGERISKSDIIIAMLCRTGVLSHAKDVSPWLQKIESLDTSGGEFLTQDQLNILLDKEAEEATTQLEHLERAKAFSVWSTLRDMFSTSNTTFTDISMHPSDNYDGVEGTNNRNSDEPFAVEMKTQGVGRKRDKQTIEDDVNSPLARNSDSEV